jgi:hypothetical protein
VPSAKQMKLDLPAGLQSVELLIEQSHPWTVPGLRCEITEPAGSPVRFRIVSGK